MPSVKALYLASIEEQAIVNCLFDFYEISIWRKKQGKHP